MALREIQRQPGMRGRGMAVASLAICYTLLGLGLVAMLAIMSVFALR